MPESKSGNNGENLAASPVEGVDAALERIAALDWRDEGDAAPALEGTDGEWSAFTGLPPKIELLDDGPGARLHDIGWTRESYRVP